MSTGRLSPFSFVILVLVGQGGAGPHDLRRMAAQGRIFWDAAPSQWYAEPKRLAELGYLESRKEPGRTRERTHYTLTERGREALEAWTRTPAGLPRAQHETVVRLLAADLVDPKAVRDGLDALETQIAAVAEHLETARSNWGHLAPDRRALLEVNDRFAEGQLELHRRWLADARRALDAGS